MKRKGKEFSEIYDLVAAACYYPFGARLLLHARCGAYAVASHAWSL